VPSRRSPGSPDVSRRSVGPRRWRVELPADGLPSLHPGQARRL
jgi:hypothetical protein